MNMLSIFHQSHCRRLLWITVAFCSLAFHHHLVAQEAASQLDAIKPLVNPTTIAIAQIDWQSIQPAKQDVTKPASNPQPFMDWLTAFRSSASPLIDERITVLLDVPFTSEQVPVRLVAPKPTSLDLKQLNAGLARFRFSPVVASGNMLVTAPSANLEGSSKLMLDRDTLSGNQAALSAAWATVEDMPVRVLVLPPAYLWSTYEDLMPQLPKRLGGSPTTVITEGIQWATIGIKGADVQITIQSKSAAAAERLVAELPKLMTAVGRSGAISKFESVLKKIKADQPTIHNDRIRITLHNSADQGPVTGPIASLLGTLLDPFLTAERQDRFKQLALGIHNYESANRSFPPSQAARLPDGTSNLSWRVHILPFIGQQKLYEEFKLNESWDSPHNIKLLEKMPDIYAGYPVPSFAPAIPPGYTTVMAPVGEGTIFGGNKPVLFSQVEDGSSNTILFVETQPGRAVPWTAPNDFNFLPSNPADGLAVGADGQFLCAMCDGSVRLFPANMPKETLLHLFQMNDQQPIRLP